MMRKMKKNTKQNLITYGIVIVAFVVVQCLIATGSISEFDARIDGSIVYLRDFGSIVKPRGRNSR